MNMIDECQDKKGNNSVFRQVILGILVNFSSIAPSMSLGFSAVALPVLKSNLNSTQLSWFASIASLATPFGCFLAGPFADKYGRRTGIFFVNIVCMLGWITISIFFYVQKIHFWILLLGRILTGLSTGLCSSPATVYMAEISSPEFRGIFTTWASTFFSLGVLIVYFLGYLLKGNMGALCLVTAVLPCIGIFVTTFFIPESPTWLVGKNRVEQAKTNLCEIVGTKEVTVHIQRELEMLIKTKRISEVAKKEKSILKKIYRKMIYLMQPHCLKPFTLVLTFFLFQQLSGIFVIIFYAIDIVDNAGITLDAYLTIVIIGVVRFVGSILPSFLARNFGRRPLSLFSGIGMSVCLLPLSLYIKLKENEVIMSNNISFLPFILLLAYFITSSIGFLPLPFALGAELFPTKVRGTAAGLVSGVGYLFNFIVVKFYIDMVHWLGRSGVFCFYGGMAFIGTIFVLLFLPETKGKSLSEIEEYFGKNKELNREKQLLELP